MLPPQRGGAPGAATRPGWGEWVGSRHTMLAAESNPLGKGSPSARRPAIGQRQLEYAEEQHDAQPTANGGYLAPQPIAKELVPGGQQGEWGAAWLA